MMLMLSCRCLCWEPYRSTYLLLGVLWVDGEGQGCMVGAVVSCCPFSLLLNNGERKYFAPATQMTG